MKMMKYKAAACIMAMSLCATLVTGCGDGYRSNETAEENDTAFSETAESAAEETVISYQPKEELSEISGDTYMADYYSKSGKRDKRTVINGENDKFTVMVYMCGTDLESDCGFASDDIAEMYDADYSDDVNILIYTGGTKRWHFDGVSTETNQIWQVVEDGIVCIEEDMGNKYMTDPDTLSEFISYCGENYSANRNALVLWDHGGGSLHGYGSDEYLKGYSMSIKQIDDALTKAGVKFDFIGFDACLMATVETACMIDRHADYMIASEELEPGCGWYYTEWIDAICTDPSMPTEEIGRIITDSYIEVCEYIGLKSTLSVIDLTEMYNVFNTLSDFAVNAKKELDNNNFVKISKAVSNSILYGGENNGYDLFDLIHIAENFDIEGSDKLIEAVDKAVVYSEHYNCNNSNGMSVYLPNYDIPSFEQMVDVYKQVGLKGAYTDFAMAYANIIAGGQSFAGSSNPVEELNNDQNQTEITPDYSEWEDYSWFDQEYVEEYEEQYIEHIQAEQNLTIEQRGDYFALALAQSDWEIVNDVDMQLMYNDGSGYINLGTDKYYRTDYDGALIIDYDGLWPMFGGRTVPLYIHESNGWVEGYIPCKLNEEYVELVVRYDENGTGYIAGAVRFYENGLSMKGLLEVNDGDKIQILCDYYEYDGSFRKEYAFGEPFEYNKSMTVDYFPSGTGEYLVYYAITDIYNHVYYTQPVYITFEEEYYYEMFPELFE